MESNIEECTEVVLFVDGSEDNVCSLFFVNLDDIYQDPDTNLYMYLVGLDKHDRHNRYSDNKDPKWFILRNNDLQINDNNKELILCQSTIGRITFDKEPRGLKINFIFRGGTGKDFFDFVIFTDHFIERLKDYSIVEVKEKFSYGRNQSWNLIPNQGNDQEIVKRYQNGSTCKEIAEFLGLSTGRISNRLTELRKTYGEDVVPYKKRRH